MMTIELQLEHLVKDIRKRSHHEVSAITDAEARYRAEAGTEKMQEITRCVGEGVQRLASRCRRYLDHYPSSVADDAPGEPQTYVFEFRMSERRALGKTEPLTKAMHDFVVEYALAKFYSTVSQSDLSNKHSLEAIETGNQLDAILLEKLPPTL